MVSTKLPRFRARAAVQHPAQSARLRRHPPVSRRSCATSRAQTARQQLHAPGQLLGLDQLLPPNTRLHLHPPVFRTPTILPQHFFFFYQKQFFSVCALRAFMRWGYTFPSAPFVRFRAFSCVFVRFVRVCVGTRNSWGQGVWIWGGGHTGFGVGCYVIQATAWEGECRRVGERDHVNELWQ